MSPMLKSAVKICTCPPAPDRVQTPAPKQAVLRPFPADKIYAHKERVQEWLDTGMSRPIIFEMDMTNVCNQKCPHCFGFYPERDQAKMDLQKAKEILTQMREVGAKAVTFTGGGDPLVNPHTLPAVEFASDLGLDIGFISNGQALTQVGADIILKRCVWARISIDAATPKIFKLTHGMDANAFEKVLNNVRLLVRRKAVLRSVTTLGVGFLTSNHTKEDIYAFAALGQELGVDYAQYRPLLKRQGEADIDYSNPEILMEITRAQRDLSNESYKVVCSEHKYKEIAKGNMERTYKKCYGQDFASVVAADGKMYVCCHMRGVEKYAIGDLSKNTMSEIWKSRERRRIADSVDFKDCPPLCRCDSFNNILWDLKEGFKDLDDVPDDGEWSHKNFI